MKAYVIGDFSNGAREGMVRAASRASVHLAFVNSARQALGRIRGGSERAACVLVSAQADPRACVEAVRDDSDYFALPVVALAEHPTAAEYQDAYFAGVDDVQIVADDAGLTRRLANLSEFEAGARPGTTLGRVAVAAPDDHDRRRLGRPLRQAGFEVDYVQQLDPALEQDEDLLFIVATHDAVDDLDSRPERTADGTPVLWFGPEELDVPALRVGDQLTNATSRLLFFADEQRTAAFKDRRKSERKLYPALCAFREEGDMQPIFGVTHNVSAGGMYVRTLDPPRQNARMWIELAAPVSETPVHLRARAVWRRLPGSGPGVLPAGFGLQLEPEGCPQDDLQAYLQGCRELSP
ncbi:MAG: PilZ domain-containing protein [Myxococcales bacterium]|jgi:hypothetical protein